MKLNGIKQPSSLGSKDPFNLSNDHWYQLRGSTASTVVSLRKSLVARVVDHAPPASRMLKPFFSTSLSEFELRHFHRMPILMDQAAALIPVRDLTDDIKAKAAEREALETSGSPFVMKSRKDLSAKDGTIILAEYSEEHPLLVMRPGMCTHIINYYRRKEGSDEQAPNLTYGTLKILSAADDSPFLGKLSEGQVLQSFENNMFRAPIYSHAVRPTDFLLIRSNGKYFIRLLDANFVVGQECPKIRVPAPNSKADEAFQRDRLKWFSLRQFRKNSLIMRLNEIMAAFPQLSESYIRNRMRDMAEFVRGGENNQMWKYSGQESDLKDDKLALLLTPEQVCAYESMQASRLRLLDAGFGLQLRNDVVKEAPAEEEEEEEEIQVEDEVAMAPWHTTDNFVTCIEGGCLLAVTGPAEPTGRKEGFSYLRLPNKPFTTTKDVNQKLLPKMEATKRADSRSLVGTKFDFRGLTVPELRSKLMFTHKIRESELDGIQRWELVHLLRECEQKLAAESGTNSMYVRSGKSAVTTHRDRFNNECQERFNIQNRALSVEEEQKSDSEDSDSGDEEGKLLTDTFNRATDSAQVAEMRDAQEADAVRKRLLGSATRKQGDGDRSISRVSMASSAPSEGTVRRLIIKRHFHFGERDEVITDQAVIDAYLRHAKAKENSKQQLQMTSGDLSLDIEAQRREKRRMAERARRQRRIEQGLPAVSRNRNRSRSNNDKSIRCGNCGEMGHMQTNKSCPKYEMYLAQQAEADAPVAELEGVKFESTKLTITKSLYEQVDTGDEPRVCFTLVGQCKQY